MKKTYISPDTYTVSVRGTQTILDSSNIEYGGGGSGSADGRQFPGVFDEFETTTDNGL